MKHAFVCAIAALIFSSCAQRFYSSGPNHIPALSQAKQLNAGGGIHITDKGSGVQIQSAYAATNQFAFMLNGHLNTVEISSTINNIEEKDKSTAGYVEGAVGFILPANKNVFETYAGVGIGSIKNKYEAASSSIGNTRIFVQPSFTFLNRNKTSNVSLGIRFSYVDIKIKGFEDGGSNNYYTAELEALRQQPQAFFFGPTLQWKFGGENHQAVVNLTVSRALNSIDYRYDRFTLGLGYNFNWLRKP